LGLVRISRNLCKKAGKRRYNIRANEERRAGCRGLGRGPGNKRRKEIRRMDEKSTGIGIVDLKVGDQEYRLLPDDELKISEETINEDLKNQASYYAFYAVMQEQADAELASAKLALEVVEALLDGEKRKEALASGTKVTEAFISQQIRLEDQYQEAAIALNRAKTQVGILRAIKDGFSHRKDMLVTLAANMRIQADPSIHVFKLQEKGDKQ
jgi:hypothetical protein